MAVLLRVLLVLAVTAAAAHEPVTWSVGSRLWLGCAVAGRERLRPRRPPPPLHDDQPRPKIHFWRRDGVEISPKRVSSNGSLEVTRRRDGDGIYQCGVRAQSGVVLGYPVNLKFASMEKEFWSVPENRTVGVEQPVVIRCQVRSEPDAEYAWYRNHQLLPTSDRYHVLQSGLLITDVRQDDAGVYHCTATNPILNRTKISPEGRLVVVQDQEYEEAAFLLDEQDMNITRTQGSYVALPCPVTGWPRPKLIWELSSPELGDRVAELEFTGEVLVLPSLQEDQQGAYSCRVEGTHLGARKFYVQISSPPNITIPPDSKGVPRAITVRFNCTASGTPAPIITWFKDGQPLVFGGRINLRTSTDGKRNELVISGVTSEDAGVYQCFARTPLGVASEWATLNVTGADAAAPGAVRCWPEGARAVRLTWTPPTALQVVAYTVHTTPQDASTTSQPGQPHTNTEELVTVDQALAPYRFQVRAYMQPSSSYKNVASDMSEVVVCQGQGVPIKMAKAGDNKVVVSWKKFASETSGVAQWIVQYRGDDVTQVHNVTLSAQVNNYTLIASPSSPVLVRVLGTRSLPWLQQDLAMVPWTSTATAGDELDDGEVKITPQDVEVSSISSRGFVVSWRCEEPAEQLDRLMFFACARKADGQQDVCRESSKTSVTFDDLEPNSEYEVRVQAIMKGRPLRGTFSAPYLVVTNSEGPQRFKNLLGQFINSSAIRVSWNGIPSSYTVHYSAQLRLPVEQWDSVQTNGNTVLITGIDPTEKTYIMVTENESQEHSKIETIQPLYKDPEAMDLHYEYTSSGVRVWWAGAGRWSVRAAQNITTPVEQWQLSHVTQPSIELNDLDPSLPVYVMVTVSDRRSKNQVLTIEPRPPQNFSWHYVIGVAVGVSVLGLLAVAAVCIWQRRKRARSPLRSRRRNLAANDANQEEGSELKSVGGRLANGGAARDAGQPLLNGHVRITHNPTLKTPNGKMRRGVRYENAFDVSRYDDPDTTLETVLDADTSSTSYNLLDTSRRPDFDLSRSSRDISANNSFNKLPDDNMNSELRRSSFELDNSKIQPTLQPNG